MARVLPRGLRDRLPATVEPSLQPLWEDLREQCGSSTDEPKVWWNRPLEEIQRDAAQRTLEHCHGSVREASRRLGVSTTILQKLLRGRRQ